MAQYQHTGNKAQAEVTTATAEDELEQPFLESFIRSFLLGVGAGVLCESAHVAIKFMGLALQTGDVIHALPDAVDHFAPLIVWDHVFAVGSWVLLYGIEAIAILSVLNRYPDDARKAARTIQAMATIPKQMLPVRLSFLKKWVVASLLRAGPSVIMAAAAAPPAALPAPPSAATGDTTQLAFRDGSASTLEKTLDDIEAAAAAPLPRTPNLPQIAPPKKSPEQEASAKDARARRARQGLRPGQWDPAAQAAVRDAARSKELFERQSYLRNFWYAAALSENLKPGEPLGVDILGSRIVLWRDPDNPSSIRCLDDACPHRGAPLSKGWVVEDAGGSGHSCDVCPYHGWAFSGDGKLRDVPSAEPGHWPKRPMISSYAIEERGGFVWLFYGDKAMPAEERPPIPFTPELEDAGWKAVYGEMEFECGHWAVFENAIDMAHIHYLHNDSFGNSESPRIMGMTAKRDTFHVEATFRIHNKPVSKLWEWTAVDSVPVHAKAMLPSTSAITIQLGAGVSMITFVNTVPISATRAVNRFCLIRNFAGWDGFDAWARNAMFKILGEDKVMIETLQPERLAKEFSLAPDAPQTAFRKLRQEWINMGYGVPPETAVVRRGLLDL